VLVDLDFPFTEFCEAECPLYGVLRSSARRTIEYCRLQKPSPARRQLPRPYSLLPGPNTIHK
jgi:hypothetical protein